MIQGEVLDSLGKGKGCPFIAIDPALCKVERARHLCSVRKLRGTAWTNLLQAQNLNANTRERPAGAGVSQSWAKGGLPMPQVGLLRCYDRVHKA